MASGDSGHQYQYGYDDGDDKHLEEFVESDPTLLRMMKPDMVLRLIDYKLASQTLESVTLKWRLVSVGNYKVINQPESVTNAMITKYGIVVTLPHAKCATVLKRLCIPVTEMIDLKFHFGNQAPLMIVKTGTYFAKWIRRILAMDKESWKGNVMSKCYYCPLFGCTTQAWITFTIDKFTEADVANLRNMFPEKDQNKGFSFTEIREVRLLDYLAYLVDGQ